MCQTDTKKSSEFMEGKRNEADYGKNVQSSDSCSLLTVSKENWCTDSNHLAHALYDWEHLRFLTSSRSVHFLKKVEHEEQGLGVKKKKSPTTTKLPLLESSIVIAFGQCKLNSNTDMIQLLNRFMVCRDISTDYYRKWLFVSWFGGYIKHGRFSQLI